MRIILVIILAFALSGCVERMEELSQEECTTIGLQPGTPAFSNCYQAAMARRMNMLQTGLRMMATPPPQPVTTQMATCTRYGNTVSCAGTAQ